MCDALSRNIPKVLKVILSNCLTHGRRNFVDIIDAFPDECRHVIKVLAKVYHIRPNSPIRFIQLVHLFSLQQFVAEKMSRLLSSFKTEFSLNKPSYARLYIVIPILFHLSIEY